MSTYPAPTPHIVRPLSPITELITPASARSISLPIVEDKVYDYQDESPIRPHALGGVNEEGDGGSGGDGDSIYSQGSSCTVVPNDLSISVTGSISPSDDAPPISPPANIRPFPTPSGSLPPPPRSATLPIRSSARAVLPISPGLAYLQDTGSAFASPISPGGQTPIEPSTDKEDEEVDRMSLASVSSAGIAGVGAHSKAAAPGPGSRPTSINVTEQYKPTEYKRRTSQTSHVIPVMPSPLGSPETRIASTRDAGYKSTDLTSGPKGRPGNINVSEQSKPIDMINKRSQSYNSSLVNIPPMSSPHGSPRSRPTGIRDAEFKPTDMANRISQSYHPSLVNIPVIPSPHGSPRIRPTSIGGQGRPADIANRVSQSYHSSMINIPTMSSPHGSPRSRPTSIRIASAHPSLVNIPIMASPVPSPRSRPNSIHVGHSRHADVSMRIPSNHSLVNIPFLPSSPAPIPKTATIASLISPGAEIRRSGIPVKSPSPTRSRPSSPKARTGTLKKRPMSLHASRPGSWHVDSPLGSSSIKDKKSGKGKRSSALIEEEGGGSSNDNHSDVSAGNTRRESKRVSRIPSLLLSLFEPSSAKQSQHTSSVKSPITSPAGFPTSPVIHEKEISDEIKGDGPPLEVIRTSGTFGIQDDGSTHLLSMDEPGSRPMTASSFSHRPQRARRDSDNGTVKSHPMGPPLYMGNPDPFRESIDESREEPEAGEGSEESATYCTPPSSTPPCGPDHLDRSLTPFKPDHPTSPLEHILSTSSPLSLKEVSPERRSVDGARTLQVNLGRSDVSQRAQSPSTGVNSGANSRAGHGMEEEVGMKDEWAQTSPAPSITSSRSKRPLPKPPASPYIRGPRARLTSLPPSAYAQPAPPPSSDLPLLIASHLLSNHATALMRHSTGLAEGAEMMKRMADESMQWGAVLLNMASGQQPGSGMPMSMPNRPWSTEVQPDDGTPQPQPRSGREEYEGMPSFASFASSLPTRPIFHPPPPPSREPSSQVDQNDDRYTPLPPRISPARRTRSNVNLYTEFYDEVEHLGRKGWDEIHQAEDIWMRGMKDLKKFLDDGPDQGRPASKISVDREEREQQGPARRPRQSGLEDLSHRQSRRSGMTTSMIRTEESFLPSPTDLLPSPNTDAEAEVGVQSGTTDDSFLNLMTPPNPRPESDNDSTVRARPQGRAKVPFSRDSGVSIQGTDYNTFSPPDTASTNSRGYESDQFLPHPAAYPILRMPPAPTPRSRETQSEQIHQNYSSIRAKGQAGLQNDSIKQKLRVNTFDLNTQPPILPHQVEKSATESTVGTGGRKLRKRSSALHLNLAPPGAQTPSEGKGDRQPSTAASTVKSKGSSRKKHWWSRRKEGTGDSIDDHARGDWRGSLTAT